MSSVPFLLPPLPEQRAIAGVLGSLDDKIEQNRRTAGVLEGLARAVFRAWFVDFEPVHAKAAGATSFPAMPQPLFDQLPTTFQDSELGPIPQGWEVKKATDLATVAIGKTPPRKEPHWFSVDPTDVRWVSIRDMGQCGAFISTTSEFLTEAAIEKCRVRRIPDRSILFSFKLTLGRVSITNGEMTSNEAIAHFIPNDTDAIGTEYLYCYLSSFDHASLGSTSSIATATNSKAVKAMPVIAAPSPVAEAFTVVVRPTFDLLRQIDEESRKLAELRDYLLPKLLSGAVRVSGVDAAGDDAGSRSAASRVRPVTPPETERPSNDKPASAAPAPSPPKAPPQTPPKATPASVPASRERKAGPAAARPRPEDFDRLEVLATLRDLYRDDPAPCDRETLLHLLKETLGFKTLSPKLRSQLDGDLRAAVRRGVIVLRGGAYHLDCRHVTDYQRDILKDLFLQALGGTWWDREAAMHQAATHLGYRRLGKKMRETYKSIINGLLRENRLETDGDQIRKQ